MVIEWLRIRVPVEVRERYIQTDAEIWTTFLASCSGFLNKETWIAPEQPDQVVLVIRWASLEQWQAIPSQQLKEVEQRFTQAMGQAYEIVESTAYQVRKFPAA